MPARYGQEAIELCRSLYCKYGGKNHDAIEAEMRRQYPGWQKANLHDRGKAGQRMGWISRYGFDNSLKLHLQKLTESVNDDEQDLYIGIREARKRMQAKVAGKDATKDDIYQYRDFCKLEIEARRNLDLSRDNLETFVSGYEKLVIWLGDLDPAAAKMLIKHGDKLAELAQAHYGKEEIDDGTSDRTDEGGERPGPGESQLRLVK